MRKILLSILILTQGTIYFAKENYGYINKSKNQLFIVYKNKPYIISKLDESTSYSIVDVACFKKRVYVMLDEQRKVQPRRVLYEYDMISNEKLSTLSAASGHNLFSINRNKMIVMLSKPDSINVVYEKQNNSYKYLTKAVDFPGNLSLSPNGQRFLYGNVNGILLYDFKKDSCNYVSKGILGPIAPKWLDNNNFIYYDVNKQMICKMNLCTKEDKVLIDKPYDVVTMVYTNGHLVFVIQIDEKISKLYDYDMSKSETKLLIDDGGFILDLVLLSKNMILYSSNIDNKWDIYELDLRNKNTRKITEGKDDHLMPFNVQ